VLIESNKSPFLMADQELKAALLRTVTQTAGADPISALAEKTCQGSLAVDLAKQKQLSPGTAQP
jgi:hypothetical protein